MGAINYGTSDYITMGWRPIDAYELEQDAYFMQCLADEVEECGGLYEDKKKSIEAAMYSYIEDCFECDYTNVEYELEKHNFHYFHITIKSGYYEGFYLDIENNYPVCFDCWEDKRDAQKEITEVKSFLLDCAGLGLVKVSPGWCTAYYDYAETVKAIGEAVKKMRDEVNNTPTWRQLESVS